MSKSVKCNICLEEDIQDPVFTPCIHGFCAECISKWISEKKQYMRIPCPVCKYDIAQLAGSRDESQLYDDDEDDPIPEILLNRSAVVEDVIENMFRGNSQLMLPSSQPPEVVPRGTGIEEFVTNESSPFSRFSFFDYLTALAPIGSRSSTFPLPTSSGIPTIQPLPPIPSISRIPTFPLPPISRIPMHRPQPPVVRQPLLVDRSQPPVQNRAYPRPPIQRQPRSRRSDVSNTPNNNPDVSNNPNNTTPAITDDMSFIRALLQLPPMSNSNLSARTFSSSSTSSSNSSSATPEIDLQLIPTDMDVILQLIRMRNRSSRLARSGAFRNLLHLNN